MVRMPVTIKFAWWFKPYIYTLAMFCALFDREPSKEHLNRVIDRGITFK